MSWMINTPKRFGITAGVVVFLAIIATFVPGVIPIAMAFLVGALINLFSELQPALIGIIMLAVMWKFLIRPMFPKGGGKK